MGTQYWVPVIDMGKNKSKDGKKYYGYENHYNRIQDTLQGTY